MNNNQMVPPKDSDEAPKLHPRMQHANDLMAKENYTEAARIFENMANRANSRNAPATPFFYIQAGRAKILAGEIKNGIPLIQIALRLFAGREEWLKFRRRRYRVVVELRKLGYKKEANELMNFMAGELPADINSTENEHHLDIKPVAGARAALPTNCPKCGAPLQSDKVDWVDENTAECPYCGNSIRSEDTNSRDVSGAQRI